MHQIKINNLLRIISQASSEVEAPFELPVHAKYLEGKGNELLKEVYESVSGIGNPICLQHLKIDFKINRFLFLYDDEVHFNRYRLMTLKTSLYEVFSYQWVDAYRRMCRNYERECIKAGSQERIWTGPPIAQRAFGKAEVSGELSGNGASGWKLNAYNDAQYDLISRLHGYKLIRIPVYENIMIGGTLRKIDDLLLQPKEDTATAIGNWLIRKMS